MSDAAETERYQRDDAMSRQGVVGPVILDRAEATIACGVIEQCTGGVDLQRTPFAALPALTTKLRKALQRRRTTALRVWTITRLEAQAGYRYLMLFSHEDVPQVLTNDEMDAVHHVALDLAMAFDTRTGPKGLGTDDVDRRLTPITRMKAAEVSRWQRRLKARKADDVAFVDAARTLRRASIPPSIRPLLTPRKNTGN